MIPEQNYLDEIEYALFPKPLEISKLRFSRLELKFENDEQRSRFIAFIGFIENSD